MTAQQTARAIIEAGDVEAVARLVEAAWQYRDDLRYPPTGDSIHRRLAMVEKVIAPLTVAERDMRKPVRLGDCAPGLFYFGTSLGFKTDYRTGDHSEVYVAANGEAFWGGVSDKGARENLLVYPVDADFCAALPAAKEG